MVLDALRERGMDVSVWGCLKHNMVSRRPQKRNKVAAGPGPRVSKAGHETRFVECCVFEGGCRFHVHVLFLYIFFTDRCAAGTVFIVLSKYRAYYGELPASSILFSKLFEFTGVSSLLSAISSKISPSRHHPSKYHHDDGVSGFFNEGGALEALF